MRRYFKSVKKKIVAALLAMSLTAGSVALAEMPEIMRLSEVQPGMSGTAYTVIDPSNELEPIDVNIVAVMGDSKLDDARILAKLSGATMEKTGGLLSGMSGSPVYIDGKLIGALSANFKDVDMNNGIITPIESMLKVWDMPDRLNKTQFKQINIKQAIEEKDKADSELEQKLAKIKKQLDEMRKARTQVDGDKTVAADAAGKDVKKAEKAKPTSRKDAEADSKNSANADSKNSAKADSKDSGTAEVVKAEKDKSDNSNDVVKEDSKTDDKEGAKSSDSESHELSAVSAYGFGQRGFSYLQERLERHGIKAMDSSIINNGPNDEVRTDATLCPGDAMGVAAVLGDFSVGAFGTVTAVDDNRILAFGHPFTHRGNVNYFMTGARVLTTVNGPLSGMKLSETDGIIGRINQDRNAAVGGILGVFPQSVPMSVTVHDKDLGTDRTYYAHIAYDEEVLTELVAGVAYGAIDKSVDRLNDSTATIKFAIRTNAADGSKIERRNMFYDAKDVGKLAIGELKDFMTVIDANKERESNISDVKVDVVIDPRRMTASLVSAVPSKQKVEPGETITFKTTIKPYRAEKIVVNVPLTIPLGQPAGQIKLDMHGGGLVNVTKALLAQQAKAIEEAKSEATKEDENEYTTAEILQDGMDAPRNNDIVIEPSVKVITTEEEQAEAIKEAKKQAKALKEQAKKAAAEAKAAGKAESGAAEKKAKAKQPKLPTYSTDYIIDNVIRTSITVVEPDPEKAKAKDEAAAKAKATEADKKKSKLDLSKKAAGGLGSTIKLGDNLKVITGTQDDTPDKVKDSAKADNTAKAGDSDAAKAPEKANNIDESNIVDEAKTPEEANNIDENNTADEAKTPEKANNIDENNTVDVAKTPEEANNIDDNNTAKEAKTAEAANNIDENNNVGEANTAEQA